MADFLHGVCTYPGLRGFKSADYTVSHGVTPGVVTIKYVAADETAAANAIEPTGDCTFTDGQRSFTLKDCVAAALSRDREEGDVWTLTLQDRRWKWQFGGIDGRYNERDNAGKIRKETRLTVWEMASRLLEAMGEADADLGDLPEPDADEELPAVDWAGENPAKALADLADLFSCRVVFRPVLNKVIIAYAGNGAELPDAGYTNYVPGMSKPVRPKEIEFVSAPVVFVAALRLADAMGEELDGSLRPIDDLSYKPAGGWGRVGVPYFDGLTLTAAWAARGKTIKDCIAAAQKSVFRYYKLAPSADLAGPFDLPGLTDVAPELKVTEAWQVVPLDSLIDTERDETRALYTDPPKVCGEHYAGAGNYWVNSDVKAPVLGGFTIDSARGLVVFNRFIYRINATTIPIGLFGGVVPAGEKGPASLVLVTSYCVRDPKTAQLLRYRKRVLVDETLDTPPRIVMRDDIQLAYACDFPKEGWTVVNRRDNLAEVDRAAHAVINPILDEYNRIVPESYSYPRLMLIDPDGAVSQVTWSVSGGVSTKASRNGEHSRYVPPYKVQRGKERSKADMERGQSALSEALKIFGGKTS